MVSFPLTQSISISPSTDVNLVVSASTTEKETAKPTTGQGHDAKQEEFPRHWISERHQGHFQRSFSFPVAVEFDRVKARLANGLLLIMAPKSTEKETGGQRIPVEV
jgi:HSP20 family protein